MGCPCAPASGPFADAYTNKWSQQPGTYSAEAYDLTTIMLTATILMATTIMAMTMAPEKHAITWSMHGNSPVRFPGAKSWPWCSRSASGPARAQSSFSFSR